MRITSALKSSSTNHILLKRIINFTGKIYSSILSSMNHRARILMHVLILLMLILVPFNLFSAAGDVWEYSYLNISGTTPISENFSMNVGNTHFYFTDQPTDDQLSLSYGSHALVRDFTISFHYQKRSGDFLSHYLVDMGPGSSGLYTSRELVHTVTGEKINYNIYNSENQVIRDLEGAESADHVLYHNDLGNTFDGNLTFTLRIPADQITTPGIYEDTVQIGLWASKDGSNWRRFDTTRLRFRIEPAASAAIAIVAPGAAFDATEDFSMNFGTLSPGLPGAADAVVRATSSYSIFASSTHGGNMKHESVEEYIPYTFSFDGSTYPLSEGSETEVLSNAAPNNVEGDRYPILITIGDFDAWKPAGDYHDNITFRITSN
jgi:spore coat protein U-like protein